MKKNNILPLALPLEIFLGKWRVNPKSKYDTKMVNKNSQDRSWCSLHKLCRCDNHDKFHKDKPTWSTITPIYTTIKMANLNQHKKQRPIQSRFSQQWYRYILAICCLFLIDHKIDLSQLYFSFKDVIYLRTCCSPKRTWTINNKWQSSYFFNKLRAHSSWGKMPHHPNIYEKMMLNSLVQREIRKCLAVANMRNVTT